VQSGSGRQISRMNWDKESVLNGKVGTRGTRTRTFQRSQRSPYVSKARLQKSSHPTSVAHATTYHIFLLTITLVVRTTTLRSLALSAF
jgi:hypothetical protein